MVGRRMAWLVCSLRFSSLWYCACMRKSGILKQAFNVSGLRGRLRGIWQASRHFHGTCGGHVFHSLWSSNSSLLLLLTPPANLPHALYDGKCPGIPNITHAHVIGAAHRLLCAEMNMPMPEQTSEQTTYLPCHPPNLYCLPSLLLSLSLLVSPALCKHGMAICLAVPPLCLAFGLSSTPNHMEEGKLDLGQDSWLDGGEGCACSGWHAVLFCSTAPICLPSHACQPAHLPSLFFCLLLFPSSAYYSELCIMCVSHQAYTL